MYLIQQAKLVRALLCSYSHRLGDVIDDRCKSVCRRPVDCLFDLGDVGDAALHIFKAGWVGILVLGICDG